MDAERAGKIAEALGLSLDTYPGGYGAHDIVNSRQVGTGKYDIKRVKRYINSPEGEKAVRDRVHCEIGGCGYEIVMRVHENGRTDYLLQTNGSPPVFVENTCRRNRDNQRVAEDMPGFYKDVLLWLAQKGVV